jgi:hypothetical protein
MSSGSKRRDPDNTFFFQKPQQRTPYRFPERATMERAARLQDLFYIPLKFLIKIPQIKKFIVSLKGPRKLCVPPWSPEAGPLWKQTPISRALLSIYFGVSCKGALPSGSPHGAPSERDVPFLEPYFIHFPKSPVSESSSRFPRGAPIERDASLQSLHLHVPRIPTKSAPPSSFPSNSSLRETETLHF